MKQTSPPQLPMMSTPSETVARCIGLAVEQRSERLDSDIFIMVPVPSGAATGDVLVTVAQFIHASVRARVNETGAREAFDRVHH